jgi:hypothetical protein
VVLVLATAQFLSEVAVGRKNWTFAGSDEAAIVPPPSIPKRKLFRQYLSISQFWKLPSKRKAARRRLSIQNLMRGSGGHRRWLCVPAIGHEADAGEAEN